MPSIVEEGDLGEQTGTEGVYAHVPVFNIADVRSGDEQRTRMMTTSTFEEASAVAAANDTDTNAPDRELARGDARYALAIDAFITTAGRPPARYRTVNLSHRGLYVDTTGDGDAARLPIGSTCRVHLRRENRRVEFDAEVVREEPIRGGFRRRYGYGLQVVLLTREAQADLDRLIAEAAAGAPTRPPPPARDPSSVLLVVIAGLLALIGVALGVFAYRNHAGPPPPPPPEPILATVERGSIAEVIHSSTAEIVAQDRVSVRATMPSARAMKALVKEGDRVTKGTLLAVPLVDEDRGAIANARSRVTAGEAMLKQALLNGDSPEEIERIRAMLGTVHGQLDAHTASWQRSRITAPIDGVVVNLHLQSGDVVAPTSLICDVVNDSVLQVRARFSEAVVPRVAVGAQADVLVTGFKTPLLAVVERVGDVVQDVGKERTVAVDLTLPKDVRVRAGSSAKVTIETERKDGVLVVPRAALIAHDGARGRVLVQEGDKSSAPRDVTLGIVDEQRAEVISGLEAGARLVVGPGAIEPAAPAR